MKRCAAVLGWVCFVATATLADSPAPDLAAWSAGLQSAVVQAGVTRPATWCWAGRECGELGAWVARWVEQELRAHAGERWTVADGSGVADALRHAGIPPGPAPLDALARALPQDQVDALLTGTIERSPAGLRLDAVLLSVPRGPEWPLPAAWLPWDTDLLALAGDSYATDETRALRPKLAEAVERAAQPGAAPAVLQPDGVFGLELLVEGQPRPASRRGTQAVVTLQVGEQYVLRLRNGSDELIGVALYVDGLNTVGQTFGRPSEGPKWLLEPGQSIEVAGWQLDDATRRPFTVVPAVEAVATHAGGTARLGLITASFYAAAERPKVGEEVRDLPVGTGQGEEEPSQVERVPFTAAPVPAATLALRYEVQAIPKVGQ